jgi:hypothetical protein
MRDTSNSTFEWRQPNMGELRLPLTQRAQNETSKKDREDQNNYEPKPQHMSLHHQQRYLASSLLLRASHQKILLQHSRKDLLSAQGSKKCSCVGLRNCSLRVPLYNLILWLRFPRNLRLARDLGRRWRLRPQHQLPSRRREVALLAAKTRG